MTASLDFQTCDEVTPDMIEAAFDPTGTPHPAQRVLRLLERMTRVAKPKTGAHRILLVLAKLAQVDWLNGRLQVTLSDFGVTTEVDVRLDDGRIASRWRSFSVSVPVSELSDWVRQWPSAIHPLTLFGEPVADHLQLRAQPTGSSPAPAASAPVAGKGSASAARADKHRKQTSRREDFELPKEAFREAQPSVERGSDEAEVAGASPNESVPPIPLEEEGWD